MYIQVYRICKHIYSRNAEITFSSSHKVAHVTRMFNKIWVFPAC